MQLVNRFSPYMAGPLYDWLSPLHRQLTHFRVVADDRPLGPSEGWLVPHVALENAKLGIDADYVTGRALLNFDLGETACGTTS